MRRVGLAAKTAVIVFLAAVGLWVYLVYERSIGKLRRTNESLLGDPTLNLVMMGM